MLASIGEMPFDRVWRNRVHAIVEGLSIPFILKADLIDNKRQVGRFRPRGCRGVAFGSRYRGGMKQRELTLRLKIRA